MHVSNNSFTVPPSRETSSIEQDHEEFDENLENWYECDFRVKAIRVVALYSSDGQTAIDERDRISENMSTSGFFSEREEKIIRQSERLRATIAKRIAEVRFPNSHIRLSFVSQNIQKYHISDSALLKQIADMESIYNSRQLAEYIESYNLPVQDRLEIATDFAWNHPDVISDYLENFHIENTQDLMKLAEYAIASERTAVNLYKFKIESEEDRVNLFKKFLSRNRFAGEYIDCFEISNEETRAELFKLLCKENCVNVKYIKNFKIEKESLRTKLALSQAGNVEILQNLNKFDISDPIALKQIAQDLFLTVMSKKRHYLYTAYRFKDLFHVYRETFSEYLNLRNFVELAVKVEEDSVDGRELNEENTNTFLEIVYGKLRSVGPHNWDAIFNLLEEFDIKNQSILMRVARFLFYSMLRQPEHVFVLSFWRYKKYVLNKTDSIQLHETASKIDQKRELNKENKDELIAVLTSHLRIEIQEKLQKLLVEVLECRNASFCAGLCEWLNQKNNDEVEFLSNHSLLEEIAACREPKLRPLLLDRVDRLLSDRNTWKVFNNRLERLKKPAPLCKEGKKEETVQYKIRRKFSKSTFCLYCALLSSCGIDEKLLDNVINWAKKNYFKDQAKQRTLIRALDIILTRRLEFSDTSGIQEELVLLKIFFKEGSKKKNVMEKGRGPSCVYQEASAIIGLNDLKALETIFANPELLPSYLLKEKFEEVVPFGKIDEFSKKFSSKITESRNPLAFIIYASSLKQLNCDEGNKALQSYGTFINWHLNDAYKEQRYKLENGSHLSQIFEMRPTLLNAWKNGKRAGRLNDYVLSYAIEGLRYSCRDYLYQKIITDKHILPEKYPQIVQYLLDADRTSMVETESLQARLIRLAEITVDLQCKNNSDVNIQKAKRLIDQLLQDELSETFKNDLKGMNAQLDSLFDNIDPEKFSIVDTDEAIDMLLCGTEVSGSCQHVQTSGYNKCLTAYLTDGKNRLVAIKNKDGTIVARSIIRILERTDTKEPVLLLERVYQGGYSKLFEDVILAFAKKRAEELNLPLVSCEYQGKPFPSKIQSHGSNAPFEYVDSAEGVYLSGVFCIPVGKLYALWLPE